MQNFCVANYGLHDHSRSDQCAQLHHGNERGHPVHLVRAHGRDSCESFLVLVSLSIRTSAHITLKQYASLVIYCPVTANEALEGWTISELPDDCEEGLDEYCQPLANATVLSSTSFPVTCSPSY